MSADDHTRAFGLRLRMLRRQAQLTQAKLAESADISCVYVNKLERGLAVPSIHVLLRLAESLNADVGDLLRLEGEAPAAPDNGAQLSPYLALYQAGVAVCTRRLVFETDTSVPLPAPPEEKPE
jgi:transcriptional regulator with XRE-family HTH domain